MWRPEGQHTHVRATCLPGSIQGLVLASAGLCVSFFFFFFFCNTTYQLLLTVTVWVHRHQLEGGCPYLRRFYLIISSTNLPWA